VEEPPLRECAHRSTPGKFGRANASPIVGVFGRNRELQRREPLDGLASNRHERVGERPEGADSKGTESLHFTLSAN